MASIYVVNMLEEKRYDVIMCSLDEEKGSIAYQRDTIEPIVWLSSQRKAAY